MKSCFLVVSLLLTGSLFATSTLNECREQVKLMAAQEKKLTDFVKSSGVQNCRKEQKEILCANEGIFVLVPNSKVERIENPYANVFTDGGSDASLTSILNNKKLSSDEKRCQTDTLTKIESIKKLYAELRKPIFQCKRILKDISCNNEGIYKQQKGIKSKSQNDNKREPGKDVPMDSHSEKTLTEVMNNGKKQ